MTARTIVDLLGNSAADPRRAAQSAASLAAGNERDVLDALGSRSGTAAHWLRALLTEKLNGFDEAARLWETVVTSSGCEMPDVLLHRARMLSRRGNTGDAAGLLRLAIDGIPDYEFLLRAEAVVRKCKGSFGCSRKIRIGLLSSSTTTFLRSVIEMMCLRDGIEPEFYEPPYGTYMQELIDPRSGLRAFRPEFIVVLLNWRDLGSDGADEAVRRVTGIWQAALDAMPAILIQFTFAPPAEDAFLGLSSSLPSGKTRMIRRINEELYERASARTVLIDAERIATAGYRWEDPLLWSSARVYPASAAIPAAAAHVVSCIRAELGMTRKLLLVDLDNTLWGGVIGEDGMEGIVLGPPSAPGSRFQELHHYLKTLTQRGVLLAVVSKNNPAEAENVFRRHQGCVLSMDDFVSFKANWDDKPSNIRSIASELRLGTDSFVFLDDNPAERARVRRELPEIIVPEISGEPAESIAALERGLYFQANRLTEEDQTRHASYVALSRQTESCRNAGSVEDYLADLAMEIEYGPVDAESSVRVTQLVNKTNQFNLTTKRCSQEEVQHRATSPSHWMRWYRLRDRFADHGLIAVLFAETGEKEWRVDTWLMSCRVIGRGVEEFMLRDLAESARERGAQRLRASYVPTPKNKLVEDLLPGFGFAPAPQPGEFVLDLRGFSVPQCRFLKPCPSALKIGV